MLPQTVSYFAGLDLGQAHDPSALAVLERTTGADPWPSGPVVDVFACRHLKRWQLGTPYPDIVKEVVTLMQTPPLDHARLVVDSTGVGRPIVDLLRAAGMMGRMDAVLITAGHAVTHDKGSGFWHVPKKELAGVLQVLLQTRRLKVADLPERELLLRELQNFKVKITAAGNEQFSADWRVGQHDDIVLALALAAWRGRPKLPPQRSRSWKPHIFGGRALQ